MADVVHAFAVPFHPSSVGLARSQLRAALGSAAPPAGLVEDAALVVSELVANAICHARPTRSDDVGVEVRLVGGRLHVAVTDGGSETVPELASAPDDSASGRGLFIVDSVSERWWWTPTGRGCTVHAVLACPSAVS